MLLIEPLCLRLKLFTGGRQRLLDPVNPIQTEIWSGLQLADSLFEPIYSFIQTILHSCLACRSGISRRLLGELVKRGIDSGDFKLQPFHFLLLRFSGASIRVAVL